MSINILHLGILNSNLVFSKHNSWSIWNFIILFSFEQFCAAVQTSMLLWKSNIIYSEGELTFLITHISEIPHVDKYCFSLCLDSLYKDLFCVTEFFLFLVWERYMNMLISQNSRIIQCKLIIILIPLVSYKEFLKVNI